MDTIETQQSAFPIKKPNGVVNSSTRIVKDPKELKKYYETCQNCNMKVSTRAMFCNHCGYVQIKNDLLYESSTSIYDPGDRTVRPWREKSTLAKNHWKNRTKKVVIGKREPWRPAMRQPNISKRIVIGVPSVLQQGGKKSAESDLSAHEKRKRYDSERKFEVRYLGRIWRKSGEKIRRKNALKTSSGVWSVASSSETKSSFVREVPDEEAFPLAVFEVDWMQVTNDDKMNESKSERMLMTLHISLYQHIMEADGFELETNKVQRWLRVGYVLENENECESAAVERSEGDTPPAATLRILDFIPNAVAKCMGIKETDWVDIDYIDPKNSYMIEHLQKSLLQIARRVVSRVHHDTIPYDQKSSILYVDSTGREIFNHGHEKDDENDLESQAGIAGSYSRCVESIRKLISKEDDTLVVEESESSSDFILRHLNQLGVDKTENQILEEERGDIEESSTDFIRRHLAESEAQSNVDILQPEVMEESSSAYILRQLAEAGLEEDNKEVHYDIHESNTGEKVFPEVDSDALYAEYEAKRLEEQHRKETVELDDLTIVDTVAQISSPIPLGAFYLNKRINTKIWMSVAWNHTNGIEKGKVSTSSPKQRKINFDYGSVTSFQSLVSMNESGEEDSTSNALSSSKKEWGSEISNINLPDNVDFLSRPPLIERVTLKLFPMYYDEAEILPKVVHFTAWSLVMLLDETVVRNQMISSNEVHKFCSERYLSASDVSAYVLFCLSKGALGAHELCRKLTKCLRYEHTLEGIRVFVSGADNSFVLATSPEEQKLKLLENEYACIVIQCLMRGAIAKRKFRNLVRKNERKRNNAATQIQRIARGYIERTMIKELIRQIQENAEKARLLAEAEARDKILFCELNSTEVEIVADCGDSVCDNEVVTDLTEMNIHVTDAESRKMCTIAVDEVNLGRVWALYNSTFKSLKFESMTEVFNNRKARKKMLQFMARNCLELFFSRQNNFMKLSLKDLCQYITCVVVNIVSASDLVNADAMLGSRFGGKSDPYVVVKLGQERYKTATKKNTLNPEYDEEASLKWNNEDDLAFEVMDKDLLSKDDVIGKCSLNIRSIGIPSMEPIALDLPLTECEHGSLQVKISCIWEGIS